MRSRTANWFECKIRYEKVMDDGLQKKVTESYVVDALSFSEAEERIIEEMSSYISGEFDVTDIKKAAYKEIFFSDDEMADKWYKAKLQFITIDEKTEKEKRSTVTYLAQAGSFMSSNTVRVIKKTTNQNTKINDGLRRKRSFTSDTRHVATGCTPCGN